MYFYVFFLFTTLAPSTLILASIDRLLLSSQNVDTRLYSSKRLAYFSISINTSVWLIFNLHGLIGIGIVEQPVSYFTCSFYYSGVYTKFVSYFLGAINIIFCFVIIILCSLTFKNVHHIREIPRKQRTQQIRRMTNKDLQLLRCLYIQDIYFLIPGTINVIFNIYQILTINHTRTDLQNAIVDFIRKFFIFLLHSYYPMNFMIFILVSKTFRHEIKRMSYKIIDRQMNPVREEDNIHDNPAANVGISTIQLER